MGRASLQSEILALRARCLEFVVRPGQTERLQRVIHENVTPVLAQEDDFEGAIVMVSKREPRLVSVFCFWREEPTQAGFHWEEIPSIRKMLDPLIDRLRGAHTFETSMSLAGALRSAAGEATVCQ